MHGMLIPRPSATGGPQPSMTPAGSHNCLPKTYFWRQNLILPVRRLANRGLHVIPVFLPEDVVGDLGEDLADAA
jgi:hypothetical protein